MALKGLSHPSTLSQEELKDIKEVKSISALSYFWLGGIVIYFMYYGKSKYAIHHARQGLILGLTWSIVATFPMVGLILSTFVVLFGLYGMLNAYLGEVSYMPLFGRYICSSKSINDIETLLFSSSKLISEMRKAKVDTLKSDTEFKEEMSASTGMANDGQENNTKEVKKEWYEQADSEDDQKSEDKPQWE